MPYEPDSEAIILDEPAESFIQAVKTSKLLHVPASGVIAATETETDIPSIKEAVRRVGYLLI